MIGLRLRQMQRSGLTASACPLLAYRFPIPFQCFPPGFPVLGRRFHDHFLDLLLEQPCSQRSQLLRVAAKLSSLKVELTIDFHVRHNHGQHFFVNIDSRYPVSHKPLLAGAESVLRLHEPGLRAVAAPSGEDNDAQLFAQTRTLRIRQSNGFDFSSVGSTSPLRTVVILPLTDFHEVSRAAGPRGQSTRLVVRPTSL